MLVEDILEDMTPAERSFAAIETTYTTAKSGSELSSDSMKSIEESPVKVCCNGTACSAKFIALMDIVMVHESVVRAVFYAMLAD